MYKTKTNTIYFINIFLMKQFLNKIELILFKSIFSKYNNNE